jgi:hypothetical protein
MKTRRAKRTTYERAWSPSFRELFDLASADWTPPATVRITHSSRRLTMRAIFKTPAGTVVTATSRCARIGDTWFADSEQLSITATITGGAA